MNYNYILYFNKNVMTFSLYDYYFTHYIKYYNIKLFFIKCEITSINMIISYYYYFNDYILLVIIIKYFYILYYYILILL